MVVAVLEDDGSAPLMPQADEQPPQARLAPIDPDERDGCMPVAPQYNNSACGELDPDSAVYERTVPVPTRRGLVSSPALFLWESRTTNVDVMSVSNTTRPVVASSSRNSERRRIQVVLPYGVGLASSAGSASNGGGKHRGFAGGGEHRRGAAGGGPGGAGGMMTGLLDSPNATALEARLNEARRARRGRDLRRERQLFLSRLTHEREERVLLEAWAATRVQALFRGFLARPRPPRPHPRQKLTAAESNRRLVSDLQAILARAGLPTIPGLGPDGRKAAGGAAAAAAAWGVVDGGGGGGGGGGRGGLRRSRSRRQRAFEDEMGTRITRVVRGFLERRRFGRRWAVWNRKRQCSGASLIQYAWRAYRKRMGWRELESEVMGRAATRIQARWRGTACRMALARRATDDALGKRRGVSAVTIQAAARRRAAIAEYGPRLTLGAARREREARAAAEAARPRRRWNRGGPAAADAGSATAAGAAEAGNGAGAGAGAVEGGGGEGDGIAAKVATTSQRAPASRPSSRKKEAKQHAVDKEPAHAWEQGPPNPTVGGGGGNSAPASSSERIVHGGNGGGNSLDENGTGDEDYCSGEKGAHGVLLSAGVRKRASQEVTSRFVRDSIHAAVINAGARAPGAGERLGVGVAHVAARDVAGDLKAAGLAAQAAAPAAPDDGDLSKDTTTGEPVPTVVGSASNPMR